VKNKNEIEIVLFYFMSVTVETKKAFVSAIQIEIRKSEMFRFNRKKVEI
jgi:hypothetical protein